MEKKFEEKPYPQLRETLISQLSLLTLATPPHSDNTLSLRWHHLIPTKPHLTLLGNHCLLSLKYASSLSHFSFLLSSQSTPSPPQPVFCFLFFIFFSLFYSWAKLRYCFIGFTSPPHPHFYIFFYCF